MWAARHFSMPFEFFIDRMMIKRLALVGAR